MTTTLEGGVKTAELNMNQPVQDIVKDYETKVHERSGDSDLCQTPREYMEPNKEALSYARKGRLNTTTGQEIPATPKTRVTQTKQFGQIDPLYLQGYDLINWD